MIMAILYGSIHNDPSTGRAREIRVGKIYISASLGTSKGRNLRQLLQTVLATWCRCCQDVSFYGRASNRQCGVKYLVGKLLNDNEIQQRHEVKIALVLWDCSKKIFVQNEVIRLIFHGAILACARLFENSVKWKAGSAAAYFKSILVAY